VARDGCRKVVEDFARARRHGFPLERDIFLTVLRRLLGGGSDRVEEELFSRRRDLFAKLDLVFMDTTSPCFEGEGGQTLGARGFSKDHRPDLKQMILAFVLDGDGRPVCEPRCGRETPPTRRASSP